MFKISLLVVLLLGCVSLTVAQNVFKSVLISTSMDRNRCGEGLRYKEGYGCEDINECREIVPCKIEQTCRNLYGSYMCDCPRGFRMDKSAHDCVDIDECAIGYCGNGQKCTNTIGSFTCQCSQGMQRIGRFCRDINECTQSPCEDNQYCINTRGSYMCECKRGYKDAGDGSCDDVDECRQGMCGALGEECRNTYGAYECICRDGYQKDERTNGRYCTDIDECKVNTTCPPNSECTNIQGSFLCRCHRGFSYVGSVCLDDRECTSGEGKRCQWRCVDLPGSYKCQCPVGYEQIDFNCLDINECDRNLATCGLGETCINIRGGYECVRPPSCPLTSSGYNIYRKVMKTDEFGYRQVTTNICRRKRCGKMANEISMSTSECKAEPLSISYHYVAIPSSLKAPSSLLHISYPARRRRQRYNFKIVVGNEDKVFRLKQPSMYMPRAHLILEGKLNGPARHVVKIDMSTYHPNGRMRDSRMLTVTIFVSMYEF